MNCDVVIDRRYKTMGEVVMDGKISLSPGLKIREKEEQEPINLRRKGESDQSREEP